MKQHLFEINEKCLVIDKQYASVSKHRRQQPFSSH